MDEKQQAKLRRYAIWLLSRRDYSQKQLEQKLASKCEDSIYIAQLIAWCKSLGYIDDDRFCALYVRRQLSKGLGKQRVLADAYGKGIDRAQLNSYLCQSEIDWFEQACNTYNKKFSDPLDKKNYQEKAKRQRYMVGRGFGFDEIEYAMQAAQIGE
ncbi:putative regulatory protein, inhibitor of RecA recombinase and coprotease activities [Pseudoalteromonas luteoviolacea B = ATCC 29581]|nr:putative regulatory protein, inhibitor of RecA recombinase and coprotease activities [Pseudoalteromonas luteoviolacea B = ATCC 29581]